ncbi:MAG: efflux RND transporter periplasmic adaptor subunit [Fibrobacterota bacterium]
MMTFAGALFFMTGCRGEQEKTGESHEGETQTAAEPDLCVLLTPDQRKAVKITMGVASREPLVRELELPGKIGPIPENILHVAARFSGIATQSTRNIGEDVRAGDTLAVIENNENLSSYSILASRNGTVIEKHVVPGEYVEAGRDLFVIADLSSVAVTLAVFGGDADIAVKGATAHVMGLTGDRSAVGTIDYISPFHDEQTRSLAGRMLLSNSRGYWKPGAFVRLRIQHKEPVPTLLVPSEAIQLLDGVPHVFIPETAEEFKALPVTLGRKGAYQTEIVKGLSAGDSLVVGGAFELKAQLAIQQMGEGDACSH